MMMNAESYIQPVRIDAGGSVAGSAGELISAFGTVVYLNSVAETFGGRGDAAAAPGNALPDCTGTYTNDCDDRSQFGNVVDGVA